jgi:hypothetical protein
VQGVRFGVLKSVPFGLKAKAKQIKNNKARSTKQQATTTHNTQHTTHPYPYPSCYLLQIIVAYYRRAPHLPKKYHEHDPQFAIWNPATSNQDQEQPATAAHWLATSSY